MAEIPQPKKAEELERIRVDVHELSWALRAVMRAHDDVDRELARHLGMRSLDYAAMDHAMSSPGPLGPADLTERLRISTGSTTELLDRLERAGHVRRDQHPTDRRRVLVRVEPAAVREMLAALEPLFSSLDTLAGTFTAAEQAVIQRYLRGVEQLLVDYAIELDARG